MVLDGWLTNLHCCVVVLTAAYFSGFFRDTADGYSSMAATLAFAKEIQAQGKYCLWTSYNRSSFNFKMHNVPIAVVFTIDHRLSPQKRKLVVEMYHALACLLPDDSDRLYAVVSHLPNNPKLYFGKLLSIQKLHRSFEEAGDANGRIATRRNSCYLVEQTITLLKMWLSKAFFFEKVIKHVLLVTDDVDQCIIHKHFRELYYRDGKVHRWFVDKIILNVANFEHWQYNLQTSADFEARLKGNMDQSVFEGTRLRLSTALSQQNHYLFNETVLKKSLTEFLREILLESVLADAVFSMGLKDKWIKYDYSDFKKHSHPISTFESWAWLLSFLRIMFFVIGAFILLITTCALCGFACMLSSIVRDDYYHRRQVRQREEELHNLGERFREAGVASEVDLTQASSMPEDDTVLSTAWSSRSREQTTLNDDDEMQAMPGTARSRSELHTAVDL